MVKSTRLYKDSSATNESESIVGSSVNVATRYKSRFSLAFPREAVHVLLRWSENWVRIITSGMWIPSVMTLTSVIVPWLLVDLIVLGRWVVF